jgi:hypothetical protein
MVYTNKNLAIIYLYVHIKSNVERAIVRLVRLSEQLHKGSDGL